MTWLWLDTFTLECGVHNTNRTQEIIQLILNYIITVFLRHPVYSIYFHDKILIWQKQWTKYVKTKCTQVELFVLYCYLPGASQASEDVQRVYKKRTDRKTWLNKKLLSNLKSPLPGYQARILNSILHIVITSWLEDILNSQFYAQSPLSGYQPSILNSIIHIVITSWLQAWHSQVYPPSHHHYLCTCLAI